jgi:arginase family enzyme
VNSPEAAEYAGEKPFKGSTYTTQKKEGKQFVQRAEDPDIGRMKKPRLVSAVCERVGKQVGDIAKKGWLPLTLGGDHSLVCQSYWQGWECTDKLGHGYGGWYQIEVS